MTTQTEYVTKCSYVDHRGKWIIRTFHATGLPYSDECCPHFTTRSEAHAALKLRKQMQAQ